MAKLPRYLLSDIDDTRLQKPLSATPATLAPQIPTSLAQDSTIFPPALLASKINPLWLAVALAVALLAGTGHAQGIGQRYVLLTWKDSSTTVLLFNVYRSATPGGEAKPPYAVIVCPCPALQYIDTQVKLGDTWYYEVTAMDPLETAPTNEVKTVFPQQNGPTPTAATGTAN